MEIDNTINTNNPANKHEPEGIEREPQQSSFPGDDEESREEPVAMW